MMGGMDNTTTANPVYELLEVTGLTPMELIERAVIFPVGWKRGQPRWSAVGAIFAISSTSSHAVCRAVGQDPNDIKGR